MRTALYDKHVALGAKIVSFAGWEMPLQYKGVLLEHKAARNSAALFDVSHMRRIQIQGKEAGDLLEYLSTNRLIGKKSGEATYTVWCNKEGVSALI